MTAATATGCGKVIVDSQAVGLVLTHCSTGCHHCQPPINPDGCGQVVTRMDGERVVVDACDGHCPVCEPRPTLSDTLDRMLDLMERAAKGEPLPAPNGSTVSTVKKNQPKGSWHEDARTPKMREDVATLEALRSHLASDAPAAERVAAFCRGFVAAMEPIAKGARSQRGGRILAEVLADYDALVDSGDFTPPEVKPRQRHR